VSTNASAIAKIEAAGVKGAGGAGFPTHIKAQGRARIVIANGIECEPVLTKDKAIMSAYPDLVAAGLRIMMSLVGADQGVVAIKRKNARAVSSMKAAVGAAQRRSRAPGGLDMSVAELDDFYPAGDEHVLVYELTGSIVPPGGIPLAADAVVNNVETLMNVALALDGAPVTRKFVTVAGLVNRPATYRVPIGMTLAQLLELAGGICSEYADDFETMTDGPMMGHILPRGADLASLQVSATTSALMILPPNHPVLAERRQTVEHQVRMARSACIQCTMCTDACPRHLLGHPLRPHIVMRTLGHANPKLPEEFRDYPDLLMAGLCTECGVCSLVCPMGLAPRCINAMVKKAMSSARLRWNSLGASGGRPAGGDSRIRVHPARAGRLIPSARIIARLGLAPYAGHGQLSTPTEEFVEI